MLEDLEEEKVPGDLDDIKVFKDHDQDQNQEEFDHQIRKTVDLKT